jgi:hypothetical protein
LGGKAVTFTVGTLAPGQSKTITLPLKAEKAGQASNPVVAKASNAAEAASSCAVVINTGDTDLQNVVVTDTAPAATKIVSASGASVKRRPFSAPKQTAAQPVDIPVFSPDNPGTMKTFLLALCLAGTVTAAHAGWLDKIFKPAGTNTTTTAAAALTTDEMTGGLKEALANGVQHAVRELGKPDGYLKNLDVKIPMPKSLQTVEKTLRAVKQDKMADEFVATLNRAAEQAVPEAADVFADSIRQMTVTDAKNILTGPNDSATQYFRKTSKEKRIRENPVARTTDFLKKVFGIAK